MKTILDLLAENPRLSNHDIAVMLNMDEAAVDAEIARLEKEGVVRGYRAIVDWSKVEQKESVIALIELKVTPRRDTGFDEIAEEILAFDEVDSVHLMSGAYDFAVYVTGRTIQDIAMFVARRLSTIESVMSTATHFVLKKYKDNGVLLVDSEEDERRIDLL
ncbi:MAG: Lrp/AsnC family transcriptional regulator [Ruminococcaceae bacterium]|nr:Lrp/AsnC family transcriptional regulator [Oscillospiraceae bacterium]